MEELNLITKALDLANKKGVYGLVDAYAIYNALETIKKELELCQTKK